MEIQPSSLRAVTAGPPDWFTGEVWLESLGSLTGQTPAKVLKVTFSPGARTAWHTHPLGQVLYIVEGVAWIGRDGQAVQEARAGDSVTFQPGERHWHGAAHDRVMSHIAVQATDPALGAETAWQEHVSESDYRAPEGR